jgi:hypothetical protein
MNDQVFCQSSSEYAERPTAFEWEGNRLEIAKILNRWRTPQKKVFQVLTTDERLFVLGYNETTESWEIDQE